MSRSIEQLGGAQLLALRARFRWRDARALVRLPAGRSVAGTGLALPCLALPCLQRCLQRCQAPAAFALLPSPSAVPSAVPGTSSADWVRWRRLRTSAQEPSPPTPLPPTHPTSSVVPDTSSGGAGTGWCQAPLRRWAPLRRCRRCRCRHLFGGARHLFGGGLFGDGGNDMTGGETTARSSATAGSVIYFRHDSRG